MQDADQGLARAQAGADFGAERPRADGVDEALDDRQRHVRLEQRDPHLAQRGGDVVFGEPAAPAQRRHRGAEAPAELIEHRAELYGSHQRRQRRLYAMRPTGP